MGFPSQETVEALVFIFFQTSMGIQNNKSSDENASFQTLSNTESASKMFYLNAFLPVV